MRCDEVIRELAVPTDDRDRTALAEHLSGCPSCAAWSRRAAQFDRLWDATRPPEPSPDAWDSVWANIHQALQSPGAERELAASVPDSMHSGSPLKVFAHSGTASTRADNRPRTRRVVAIVALVGLAQAAAILIAVGLAWHAQPAPPDQREHQVVQITNPAPARGPSAVRVTIPVVFESEIEEGHQIKFRVVGSKPEKVDVTPSEMAYGIVNQTPDNMMMFNTIESIANPMVASQ